MIAEHAPIYLMSPPRKDWALRGKANFKSQTAPAADAARAREEWTRLADAIVEAGAEVLVMPPHEEDNLTGMIYTAEAGEFFRDPQGQPRFLLPHMAAAHRRDEAAHIARFIEGMGISTEPVSQVWESQGDAIRARGGQAIVHTYGVGPFARTQKGAYREVAHKLGERHIQIEFIADPWFHGNTFMQVFDGPDDDAVLIVCPEALAAGELERLRTFLKGVAVVSITAKQSLGYDTNSVQVGQTVLAPTTMSNTTFDAVRELGLEVVKLDLGELFLKGGGAPVCLTNRLWGLRLDEIDSDMRWSARPSITDHTGY